MERRDELEMKVDSVRARLLTLAAIVSVTAIGRVWIIRHFPEPDGDAKGHLAIAAALLVHPSSVAVHWVWPPGYHYFLAALLAAGFTAQGVRLLNCALAALLPPLVWGYTHRTTDRDTRLVPMFAAVLCAAMPVVNLLGTSAQQATLFTILVLATVWGIETRRFALAGISLAFAAMVRYEAWGAVALLAALRGVGFFPRFVKRAPRFVAGACNVPLWVIMPPLVAIAGWFVAHRVADGSWFGFLHELYRHAHHQRDTFHKDVWTDLLWFPVMQPCYLFGLTLPLVVIGMRRAWRASFVVPLGIYLFLLASYTFKGALGSARYYESLAPFVCIAAAHGASVVGARWRRSATTLVFAAALAHVVWLLVLTGRWTFHA